MVMQCGCWQQVALFNGAGSNGDDVSSATTDIIGLPKSTHISLIK